MDKLPYEPSLRKMLPNFSGKKSDVICISLGQQTWRDFDFLSPASNIFQKCQPACNPNVLSISQTTVFLGLNCTTSHVNALRRTQGGCKDLHSAIQSISYKFFLFCSVSVRIHNVSKTVQLYIVYIWYKISGDNIKVPSTKQAFNKYNKFSLLRLQILEFALFHLFQCFVEGKEQTHQWFKNVDQMRQVFEHTNLFVVFQWLLATDSLFWALQAELLTHRKVRIFHWQWPQVVLKSEFFF